MVEFHNESNAIFYFTERSGQKMEIKLTKKYVSSSVRYM